MRRKSRLSSRPNVSTGPAGPRRIQLRCRYARDGGRDTTQRLVDNRRRPRDQSRVPGPSTEEAQSQDRSRVTTPGSSARSRRKRLRQSGRSADSLHRRSDIWSASSGWRTLPTIQNCCRNHGIGQAKFRNATLHIAFIAGKEELWSVYADHREPFVLVSLVPCFDIGQGADTVHAGVIPEINQHHASAKVAHRERRRVKPYAPNLRRANCAFFAFHVFLYSLSRSKARDPHILIRHSTVA